MSQRKWPAEVVARTDQCSRHSTQGTISAQYMIKPLIHTERILYVNSHSSLSRSSVSATGSLRSASPSSRVHVARLCVTRTGYGFCRTSSWIRSEGMATNLEVTDERPQFVININITTATETEANEHERRETENVASISVIGY